MVGNDGVEGLGQMLCSCGPIPMICQRFHTDLESCLPFNEHGLTTGRIVLELDALESLKRRVSREWRRALEIL